MPKFIYKDEEDKPVVLPKRRRQRSNLVCPSCCCVGQAWTEQLGCSRCSSMSVPMKREAFQK